jgi:hypothetical protein
VLHLTGNAAAADAIVLIVSPLWFAATYCALVVIAPWAWAAQRRWPVATPVAMLGAVIAVDVARFAFGASGLAFGLVAFVVVWAAVHQLGFAWSALRDAAPAVKVGVAVAGYVLLGATVVAGVYPPSMVGTPGQDVSNMSPPDLAIVLLAVGQLGLLALAAPAAQRFAARNHTTVSAASSWSMTVFVWHLLAWVAAYGIVRTAGIAVPGDPSGAWWLQRPLWLLVPAAVAVPLCVMTRRFDRG